MKRSNNSLESLCYARDAKRKRVSSYDRSGGNDDRVYVKSGDTYEFAHLDQPGCITHIWVTLSNVDGLEKNCYRKVVLEFYWDGEKTPSVEAPIGDFFGMGHAMSKNFVSAPLQMSPKNGQGFNSWWQMPYNSARLFIRNECDTTLVFYYYVDYEEYEKKHEDDVLRFHARWHRECPTSGIDESTCRDHDAWCFEGKNLTGEDNYVIMEAVGKGHYCGANINIHNFNPSELWDWPGEGDDMIFIDGDKLPTLNGTGTEDYVNMAWCPAEEYSAPYHGLILKGEPNWKGKITYYRYHILDPIMFNRKVKVTIEHGHCNHRSDDWSSTAYWYQTEPHAHYEKILPMEKRLPIEVENLQQNDITKSDVTCKEDIL